MAQSDSPKVFNLDAVKVEGNLEPFHFAVKGERYTVPSTHQLDTFDLFDDVEQYGDAGAFLRALKRELGEDKVKTLRKTGVTTGKFNQLVKAWQEHSGLAEGESEASTAS